MTQTKSRVTGGKKTQCDKERSRPFSERMGRTASVLLATAVLTVSGCGATRPSKYYQLSLSNNLSSGASGNPFPVTLILGHLKASHLYREDRIVYSGRGEEMGTYEYQRWTEPPTEMIEETLLRELRASGDYEGVYSQGSGTRGDFLLLGHLFDFKELSGETLQARLTIDLELRDIKSGITVWTRHYTHDEPVEGKDVSGVVAALNRNVQRCVAEVAANLDEFFRSRSAKSQF